MKPFRDTSKKENVKEIKTRYIKPFECLTLVNGKIIHWPPISAFADVM